MNNDRAGIQTQSAWLHAASPGVWTAWEVLSNSLSLSLKLLLMCKASSGNFSSLVRSTTCGSKKSTLPRLTYIQVCVSTGWSTAKHDTTHVGLGQGALIESLGRISTGRNLCDFADTACQPQETFVVIRVAWEEVKTSGFVTFFQDYNSFWGKRWNFKH